LQTSNSYYGPYIVIIVNVFDSTWMKLWRVHYETLNLYIMCVIMFFHISRKQPKEKNIFFVMGLLKPTEQLHSMHIIEGVDRNLVLIKLEIQTEPFS
jgi:hypothetical protein